MSEEQENEERQDEPAPVTALAPVSMFGNENVSDLAIDEEIRESYLTYAMSTIMDRALPDVRDGLKPSQRRVLVAMNDLNLGPRSKHRKCAKIAGDTSGNYHPHGESVVYPTLVRMGQHWNLRYTLVDPQGNFGSIDGDPPAAMRYTEARMTAPAVDMMEDINLGTVDMVPNYDDTRTEPTVLPSRFPNLLVNGGQGIAVGMATSIPPHNLREVCDALVFLMRSPEATIEQLMKHIKGPDLPTGGIICGTAGCGFFSAYTAAMMNSTVGTSVLNEITDAVMNSTPAALLRFVTMMLPAVPSRPPATAAQPNENCATSTLSRKVLPLRRSGSGSASATVSKLSSK